jgi:hypothetical protein
VTNPIDILKWPDGFWCFQEELSSGLLRDDSYRIVAFDSQEWLVIARQRPLSTYPS